MKDYYALLGLSRNASAASIKSAYRKLAIQYHPDKNPDPTAEQIIKEINEAYDVLSDPVKKNIYDNKTINPLEEVLKTEPQPRHRDPAYRRKRPATFYKSERERLLELMVLYHPFTRKVIIITFSISIFFMVDFLLPARLTRDVITGLDLKTTHSRGGTDFWYIIFTKQGYAIDIQYRFSDYLRIGQPVTIVSSCLLNIPLKINVQSQQIRIWKSIYGNFIFAPIALLLTASRGMYFRKNAEYGFNMAVVNILVLIFTIVLYMLFN
jgi:hypothetical protein